MASDNSSSSSLGATDRGAAELEIRAEKYCHARAAGEPHQAALNYAFENEGEIERSRATLYYARWLRRQMLMPRINFLKTHPDLINFDQ